MRPAVIFFTAIAVATNTASVANLAAAGSGWASGGPSVPVEVVIVLDASSSVRYGTEAADRDAQVRDVTMAAWAVLNALGEALGVDARVSVVSYDKHVRIHVPLTGVTKGTTGTGGVFGQALGDPSGEFRTPSAAAGYAEHLRGGNGSNWEAALAEAHQLLGAARADSALVVVHVTDGEPTARLDADGEPILGGDPDEHLAAAAEAANRLKNDNMRLLAVGIGEARSRRAALVAVSGPDVYDQSSIRCWVPARWAAGGGRPWNRCALCATRRTAGSPWRATQSCRCLCRLLPEARRTARVLPAFQAKPARSRNPRARLRAGRARYAARTGRQARESALSGTLRAPRGCVEDHGGTRPP